MGLIADRIRHTWVVDLAARVSVTVVSDEGVKLPTSFCVAVEALPDGVAQGDFILSTGRRYQVSVIQFTHGAWLVAWVSEVLVEEHHHWSRECNVCHAKDGSCEHLRPSAPGGDQWSGGALFEESHVVAPADSRALKSGEKERVD